MAQIPHDLFSQPATPHDGRHIFTVSELTRDIKGVLENTFGAVWVEGEISGISRITTGTVFFSLKDASSLLKCVVFHSYSRDLKFELKDGIKIVCFGKVGVYEKDGKYQLYVEKAEPKGVGSLQLALEQLKEKLEKEGLFAPDHKRPIPYLPSRIGVVTSPTGAAIKDMLKVLNERFRDVHIIINPARVQGEGAKEEIAAAIEEFNRFGEVDVLIVGRGGGSIEDLWAFNEEVVARAIYNSRIPVISAVGHERDWTIADLVADVRAATPSVAAQMVIPKKEDLNQQITDLARRLAKALLDASISLQETVDNLAHRLGLAMEHAIELTANGLQTQIKKLALLNPSAQIQLFQTQTDDLARQMYVRLEHLMRLKESECGRLAGKLASLSPLNILARGYSITFKIPEGSIVKDARMLKPGDTLKTRVHEAEVVSTVKEVTPLKTTAA